MPMDWEWGFLPFYSLNPPTAEACERFPRIAAEALQGPIRKRALDKEDPDPHAVGHKHKMGRTHTSRPDLPSASANPPIVEHVSPLEAEVGPEFLEKLASRGQKKKAPAPEAGTSDAPPAKRSRKEIVGGKEVMAKRYRKREMPVTSGPALKITKSATGMRPEGSEGAARASPPPQPSPVPSGAGKSPASPRGGNTSAGRAAPESTDHRAEEDFFSPPEAQDTGANNIGAGTEDAGRAEPLVPPVPEKTKTSASSPSKSVPDSSAPASSSAAKDAPDAPAPPPTAPTGKPATAKPTPSEGAKFPTQDPAAVVSAASSPSSGWITLKRLGHPATSGPSRRLR